MNIIQQKLAHMNQEDNTGSILTVLNIIEQDVNQYLLCLGGSCGLVQASSDP